MHPILLKGHERPVRHVCFNRDGDLLFTCGLDSKVSVWYSDTGERLGTYNGHKGAVWFCDTDFKSDKLVTASADCTAKLWNLQNGKELSTYTHQSPVRSVAFSYGDQMILTVTDGQKKRKEKSTVYIFNVDSPKQPVRSFTCSDSDDSKFESDCKYTTALWGSLNQTLISADDHGSIYLYDVESEKLLMTTQEHTESIQSLQFNSDKTMFLTASLDMHAKLFDVKSMKCIKTYKSDRPLNCASPSPRTNHILLAGGQQASEVTTTTHKTGRFQIDFYHTIYQTFLDKVDGHFGPVYSLAFSPDGCSFASGSHDGFVRLHHFPKEYFDSSKEK